MYKPLNTKQKDLVDNFEIPGVEPHTAGLVGGVAVHVDRGGQLSKPKATITSTNPQYATTI